MSGPFDPIYAGSHVPKTVKADDPLVVDRARVMLATMTRNAGDCIIWCGAQARGGYGQVSVRPIRKPFRAHRLAWMLAHGDIPSNLMVLHKCRNRLCVNVRHLYVGTAKDNAQDSIRDGTKFARCRGITTCKNGHKLEGVNVTYFFEKGAIRRACVACRRAADARYRERRRGRA